MAIFTSLAVAGFLAVEASFFTAAIAFGLNAVVGIAASLGLSYAAQALAGNPNGDTQTGGVQGVQGTLQSGADVPRSFNLGYSVTAGSLVYANTWNDFSLSSTNTPNAFLTQVIALADLPGGTLEEIWVNGELCTLGSLDPNLGYVVTEYNKDGLNHLWIRYYDGTQTTADDLLLNTVASTDRPYESTRVGTGVAYVVVTSLVEDTLFTGFPTFKFAVSGVPLYDPTKDSTNGGDGAHRYSDPTTWGGDGDDLPAVQAYNILRGIYYNDIWLYGLQRMTAARLPAANWNAQIEKCRAVIAGVDGDEPTYRTGGQVSVNVQTVQTIESLLTGCQGRLSEIGGFYKIHLGAPDGPMDGALADDDILSTEEQNFSPFFGLADSVNGITASYPDPEQGWEMTPAPPLYDTGFEAKDGDRRLLANPSFDFVPYPEQVQRLQKSALAEARRERRHTLVLPPQWAIVEPGDILPPWTSERNGYVDKLFRVDGVTDKANLDVIVNITEVDPADYDWDHDADYRPVTTGPTVMVRPAPQGVLDWFAEPYTLLDTGGQPRRPAIRLSWDGGTAGVVGVQYEVRLESSGEVVTRGRTDQLTAGAIIVSQSLIPDTDYEARGQYLPSWPRDMLWSDWLPVTTPDVRASLVEFDDGVRDRVTVEFDAIAALQADMDQRFATLTSKLAAQGWLDIKSVRSQLAARSENALAQIDEVRTVAVDATSAIADLETAVTAEFDGVNATVTEHTTSIATLDGYAAGSWGVVVDVNGKITAAVHLDGSSAGSVFDILASTFRVSEPGVTGGASVPVFTISNVSGTPKLVWRGDMTGDGSITAATIAAGAVTTVKLDAQAVTAAKIAAGTITSASGVIGALGVTTLSIGDNAVTVPVSQTLTSSHTSGTASSISVVVDTTGLTGKSVTILIGFSGTITFGAAYSMGWTLLANGTTLRSITASGMTDPSVDVTSTYTFTATGGVQTIPVVFNYGDIANSTLVNRTLWAVAAKR